MKIGDLVELSHHGEFIDTGIIIAFDEDCSRRLIIMTTKMGEQNVSYKNPGIRVINEER